MYDTCSIELEITSKCTLYCPDCARTKDPDEKIQKWNFGQLSLSAIERVLDTPAGNIILSGCYGDPIYHTEFHDVIRTIKRYNKSILINTNGSYRDSAWWTTTASLFDERDIFVFSIDGLPGRDLYRVNSNWPSIENGIKIMAGQSRARVHWKWIVFKYNENDTIEAYKLSKMLNVNSFSLVDSGRPYPDGMKPTRSFKDIESQLEGYINEIRS